MSYAYFRAASIMVAALVLSSSARAHNFAERWKALYSGGDQAILETKNAEVRSGLAEARPNARRGRMERERKRKWYKRGKRWRYVYSKRRR